METSREFDVNCITEVELIYRNPLKPSLRPVVSTAKMAYELFMKTWDLDKIELQEQFKVMLLNRANKVLGIVTVSAGGTNATVVDKKLIFATALKANASKIILAHNHPSGGLKPSDSDLVMTDKVALAGKVVEISVEDHLIITRDSYYSFRDDGLINVW